MTIVRRKPDQNNLIHIILTITPYDLLRTSVNLGTYIPLHSQPFSKHIDSNRALLFSPSVIFRKLGWGSPVQDFHSC